tara:strand:- start:22 stop:597 length:576 start_codon:yes stop_codon:yes gene_type:complete
MANTTFNGPVRSENGFEAITKNTSTGAVTKLADLFSAAKANTTASSRAGALLLNSIATDSFTVQTYQASITIGAAATTGNEASIGMPANFLPVAVMITVDTAATNAVNLQDIGVQGDTDDYVDGISVAVNSTGFKGIFGCNGLRGISGTDGALATADEVAAVVSGVPGGSGVAMTLTFIGIVGSQTLDLTI